MRMVSIIDATSALLNSKLGVLTRCSPLIEEFLIFSLILSASEASQLS